MDWNSGLTMALSDHRALLCVRHTKHATFIISLDLLNNLVFKPNYTEELRGSETVTSLLMVTQLLTRGRGLNPTSVSL